MREHAPGIFVGQLFTPREAADILVRCRTSNSYKIAPNSMNKYGMVLRGRALRTLCAALQGFHVEPIAAKLGFPKLQRNPYAFLVDYSTTTQRSLAAHEDDSAVTLNVCLGAPGFEGGDLIFPGLDLVVVQKIGRAIIHRGDATHQARPLKAGERTNLVLWCRARKS